MTFFLLQSIFFQLMFILPSVGSIYPLNVKLESIDYLTGTYTPHSNLPSFPHVDHPRKGIHFNWSSKHITWSLEVVDGRGLTIFQRPFTPDELSAYVTLGVLPNVSHLFQLLR